MDFRHLFPNRLAKQSFALLVGGTLIIFFVLFFVLTGYWQVSHDHFSRERLARDVMRLVSYSQRLSVDDLRFVISQEKFSGVRARIFIRPTSGLMNIEAPNLDSVRQQVLKDPSQFRVTLPLKNGWQFLISTRYTKPYWFYLMFALASVLSLLALILLCAWVVSRICIPLDQFTRGAKRFGQDVNAPPLPEVGPEPIREAANAFNNMQARIRRLLTDRTQMLAAISHDLRSPITRLKLRAENLEGEVSKKISHDLEQMDSMIGSILSFARDYSESEALQKFNFAALLETIVNEMMDTGYNVSLVNEVERFIFNGRMSALKRAITNVIENAVRYAGSAQVEFTTMPNHIEVRVRDDGPGINESEMEKVFLPFYRSDPSRSPQIHGTGLGLAVARDIVLAHGGDISLRNRKPKGLCVLISLPLEGF